MTDGLAFRSFFQAGFECSSHRRSDGVRLDLIKATAHDLHALGDYTRCADRGLLTIRDGLRWHLIEPSPGTYDWSSWVRMLNAAEDAGVQIIWDIFHYGSPNHIDQGASDFSDHLSKFAAEAVRVHRTETGRSPLLCPANEISFISWAVEAGYFPRVGPREIGWFKRHLTNAATKACHAMRDVDPGCRFVWAEPLIHIAPRNHQRAETRAAEERRLGQFEAYDWITGSEELQLGGSPDLVDVIGVNFYPHNQWYLNGPTIPMGHHEYRPLADMLIEVWQRYGKPIMIAETGAEGSGRPAWLHYVCDEVRVAMRQGVHIQGICLYPITAYPGWDNSRHAEVGLFSTIGSDGQRETCAPLFHELERQRAIFASTALPDQDTRLPA